MTYSIACHRDCRSVESAGAGIVAAANGVLDLRPGRLGAPAIPASIDVTTAKMPPGPTNTRLGPRPIRAGPILGTTREGRRLEKCADALACQADGWCRRHPVVLSEWLP